MRICSVLLRSLGNGSEMSEFLMNKWMSIRKFGRRRRKKVEVSRCEKKALVYVRVPGNYNSDSLLDRLEHMIGVVTDVNVFRDSLTVSDILEQVSYQDKGELHPLFMVRPISWTLFLLHFRLKFSKKSERAIM